MKRALIASGADVLLAHNNAHIIYRPNINLPSVLNNYTYSWNEKKKNKKIKNLTQPELRSENNDTEGTVVFAHVVSVRHFRPKCSTSKHAVWSGNPGTHAVLP